MKVNIVRLFASFLLLVSVSPQAFAQDADEKKDEGKKAGTHYHLGTMTPPNQASMDIKYVMTMADGEHTAWIVTEANGEDLKIKMMDLEMTEGVVSYNWSPPDSDVTISCELESDEDGGWAGDCIGNGEDGDIGQMTMGPMMDHDGDHNADHNADHDADDDGDHEYGEDNDTDS